MKIPSNEDFIECIAMLKKVHAKHLREVASKVNHNADEVLALYERRNKHIKEISQPALDSKLFKWFESQPFYKKAQNSFWPRKKNEIVPTLEERVMGLLGRTKGKRYITLHYNLQRMCDFNWLQNELTIAKSLFHYFYEERHLEYLKRNIIIAAESRKYLDAVDYLLNSDFVHENPNIPFGSVVSGALTKGANAVRQSLDQKNRFKSPIKRNDSTIKERVLAYELWRGFFENTRQNKSTSIVYLLQMDGIKNPLDDRSIERYIAEWKESRKSVPAIKSRFD